MKNNGNHMSKHSDATINKVKEHSKLSGLYKYNYFELASALNIGKESH